MNRSSDTVNLIPQAMALPPRVDLRPQSPPVYDQGQLGSCTANAIAGAIQFDEIRSGIAPTWTPSRLFIYYNERRLEGTTNSDSGAQLRDGIKTVAGEGFCPESEWPYVIASFAQEPPANCYADAVRERVRLPPGYRIEWSGQFEYMRHAKARLQLVVPATLAVIFTLLYLNFGRLAEALIVMLSVPFALVGGVWLMWWLSYNLSVAVVVGFIALAGVAVSCTILVTSCSWMRSAFSILMWMISL